MVFTWSLEKNELLKSDPTRNFKGFEDVVGAILENRILDILKNKNYPNQLILVVDLEDYVYAVPISLDIEREEDGYTLFVNFKTLFPSRKLYKKYKRRIKNEGVR